MKSIITHKYFRSLMFLIGAAFLIAMIVATWDETKQLLSDVNWVFFSIAVLVGIADHALASLVLRLLMFKYGLPVTQSTVTAMYFYGQVSKYIPGRFWSVLFQRTFVQQERALPALLAVNVELLLLFVIRNFAMGLALLLLTYNWPIAILVLLGGAIAFEVIGGSQRAAKAFANFAEYVGKSNVVSDEVVHLPARLMLAAMYSAAACTFLASNFLVMFAVFGMTPGESYPYVAAMGLAWVIGALVVVVPAGVGVREAAFVAMAALSGADISVAMLTSIAVIYRFWHVAQEGGGILFAIGLRKIFKTGKLRSTDDENSHSDGR